MWPCLMHGLMIATMALKPTLLVSTHATTAHLTDVRTGGELTRHLLKCKKLQDRDDEKGEVEPISCRHVVGRSTKHRARWRMDLRTLWNLAN